MIEKKHYHLMSGSVLELNPQHVEFYTDCTACKKRFDEMKESFMKANDTPDHKLFVTLDEYEKPSYTKVAQFGHVSDMKEMDSSPVEGLPAISGNWVPNYMIMLVECSEANCLNKIN